MGRRGGRRSIRSTSVRLRRCLLVSNVVAATLGDLVGQWKFDESPRNVANDSSSNGHTGEVSRRSFTSAGVKVTAVKSLYVGVGNHTAPTANSAGRLFIDDIRVTKP